MLEDIEECQGVVRQHLRDIEPYIETSSYLTLSTAIYEAMDNIRKSVKDVSCSM